MDRDLVLAWQMANFSRAKKLPNLKALLAKRDMTSRPQRQTAQEMRNVLQAIGLKSRPMGEDTKKALRFIKVPSG